MADRVNWDEAPIVYVYRQACPHCACEGYTRTDTIDQGDGSICRRCICRQCSQPYRVVEEEFPFKRPWELLLHESWEFVDSLSYIPPNDEP